MIALIDADSIVYILAWAYRDSTDKALMEASCDSLLHQMLDLTKATGYFASFSAPLNFRYTTYKYAPYKSGRPPKSDQMIVWEKFIKNYFTDNYGFYTPENLEADDIICMLANDLQHEEYIVCSPDKDLRQIPGMHFDYRKLEKPEEGAFITVTAEEASHNFWMQMLTGDGTDNIKGIPGTGEVKAKLMLKDAHSDLDRMSIVLNAYIKYFGHYYGEEIYKQTVATVQLMSQSHPLWSKELYEQQWVIRDKPVRETHLSKELRELNWLDD